MEKFGTCKCFSELGCLIITIEIIPLKTPHHNWASVLFYLINCCWILVPCFELWIIPIRLGTFSLHESRSWFPDGTPLGPFDSGTLILPGRTPGCLRPVAEGLRNLVQNYGRDLPKSHTIDAEACPSGDRVKRLASPSTDSLREAVINRITELAA